MRPVVSLCNASMCSVHFINAISMRVPQTFVIFSACCMLQPTQLASQRRFAAGESAASIATTDRRKPIRVRASSRACHTACHAAQL